jgi:hypothetical protein
MNVRKIFIVIISYASCAIAGTFTAFGMISSVWFFFFSESDNKFYWGGGSILLIFTGYLIYRFAFPNIQSKWDDYY